MPRRRKSFQTPGTSETSFLKITISHCAIPECDIVICDIDGSVFAEIHPSAMGAGNIQPPLWVTSVTHAAAGMFHVSADIVAVNQPMPGARAAGRRGAWVTSVTHAAVGMFHVSADIVAVNQPMPGARAAGRGGAWVTSVTHAAEFSVFCGVEMAMPDSGIASCEKRTLPAPRYGRWRCGHAEIGAIRAILRRLGRIVAR